MEGIPEVAIGYGVSDEFRYLFSNGVFFLAGGRGCGRGKRNSQQERSFLFLSFSTRRGMLTKKWDCVLVLCSDDCVRFLTGGRGDLIFFSFLPLYEKKIELFHVGIYIFFLFLFSGFFFPTNTQGATRPDHSKILTTIVSTFTSYYIHLWPSFFPDKPLSNPLPSFDGRIVQYPTVENLRDYLSWRQVDCMFCFVLIFLNFSSSSFFPFVEYPE